MAKKNEIGLAADRLWRHLMDDEDEQNVWPDDNGLDQMNDYELIVRDWLRRHWTEPKLTTDQLRELRGD